MLADTATTTRGIPTDDGSILAISIDGPAHAPAVVLSSSLGTTAEMWRPQLDALASRFRVIRHDTRGHGSSQVPRGAAGPTSIERLGRDVVAILDALEIERAHHVGVSLGGMVGQWLAVHAPARIERLVLANTAAYMGPPAAWEARIEAVLSSGMAAIADAVVERWFTPRFRAQRPEVVADLRAMLLATPPQGYTACCAAVRDMDQRAALSAIRTPTLVIAGSVDTATPLSTAEEIARAIAGARLITVDAAHLSNIEQPSAFSAAVIEHLS